MGFKKKSIFTILCVLGVLFWLFTGVYKDSEFGDKYWFIKHKPTWQFYFTANEEDGLRFDTLTPEQQEDFNIFQEYYKNKVLQVYIPF